MIRSLRRAGAGLCCLLLLSGCAAQKKPQTSEEYLQRGDELLGRKQERQARRYYQDLLEQFPESEQRAQAQFKIADSLYGEHKYLEARFEYQQFLEQYPTHPLASRAQFQLAMCSLRQTQFADRDQRQTREALQTFRHFRRTYPYDPLIPEAEAHINALRHRLATHEFLIARFYYRKGAYQAAIGRLLNLIQVYPTMPNLDEALYLLADSYQAEENYDKAQRVLRLLVERFPTSPYLSRAHARLRSLPVADRGAP